MKQKYIFLPARIYGAELFSSQIEMIKQIDSEAVIEVADFTLDDTIEKMADRVIENNIKTVSGDTEITLISASMGGYVALEIISRKLPAEIYHICKVVLASTNGHGDTIKPMRENEINYLLSLKDDKEKLDTEFKRIITDMVYSLTSRNSYQNKEMMDSLVNQALSLGVEVYIRQQQAIMNRKDFFKANEQRHINPEFMMIVGEHDPNGLTDGLDLIRNSSGVGGFIRIIKNAGHLCMFENPAEFNKELSYFL